MELFDVLHAVEEELPRLLIDEKSWKTVLINYHPPIVERLWQSWGPFRIYLHRIHPCLDNEALFHPHPWPSAIKLISGRYETAISYGEGKLAPPVAAKMIIHAPDEYEMSDPNGWHYVRPLDIPSYSLMVTGLPWERWAPQSDKKLVELSYPKAREILDKFREHYPAQKIGEDNELN